MPKISIAIPVYPGMKNGEALLQRCLASIKSQIFTDYEIVMTREGGMAENTNKAIKQCKGELIKILFQDDYFAHPKALQTIVDKFTTQDTWMATACNHDPGGNVHYPKWNNEIYAGNNTIGSPSVITMRNGLNIFFNEDLKWVLDCDFYKRMYDEYGEPEFLDDVNVTIGLHEGQATNTLSNQEKLKEMHYLINKYI